MKQKLLLSGMIVCFVLLATHASAQPCRRLAGAPGSSQGNWNCPLWQDLAPEQQAAINKLRNDVVRKTSDARNQIHKKRLEIDLLLLESEPDTDKLMKLQKEISALNAMIDEEMLAYLIKAREKMTAEQRALFPPGCFPGMGSQMCGPGGGRGSCFGAGIGCGMRPGRCGGWFR